MTTTTMTNLERSVRLLSSGTIATLTDTVDNECTWQIADEVQSAFAEYVKKNESTENWENWMGAWNDFRTNYTQRVQTANEQRWTPRQAR